MLNKIIRTSDDWALTLLRVAPGVMVFPHGAQKVLGWFGGPCNTFRSTRKNKSPRDHDLAGFFLLDD